VIWPPSDEVRAEIRAALESTADQLGQVYRLIEAGAATNRELVDGGGGANQGAAANTRVAVRLLTEGIMPSAPSIARQCIGRIRTLIRRNTLSLDTIQYLNDLVAALDELTFNDVAQAHEAEDLEERSRELEASIGSMPGIYVYSLPTFLRVPQKVDPDRYWFKVGKSERSADERIGEQQRQTGLPEDYVTLRVYLPPNGVSLKDAERIFHDTLNDIGHARSTGKRTGREWFATTLEALDRIATNQGYTIKAATGDG
jgi:hypothetical protein